MPFSNIDSPFHCVLQPEIFIFASEASLLLKFDILRFSNVSVRPSVRTSVQIPR